jgi:hypothetical protein
MADAANEFEKQLAQVRPVTRQLIESVLLDAWPSHPAVIVDFGLDSQEHYEALYYPIRNREILPQALDEALGHGEKLTALAKEAPSNPHKDVQFSTSWDVVFGRKGPTLSEDQPTHGQPEPSRNRGR